MKSLGRSCCQNKNTKASTDDSAQYTSLLINCRIYPARRPQKIPFKKEYHKIESLLCSMVFDEKQVFKNQYIIEKVSRLYLYHIDSKSKRNLHKQWIGMDHYHLHFAADAGYYIMWEAFWNIHSCCNLYLRKRRKKKCQQTNGP